MDLFMEYQGRITILRRIIERFIFIRIILLFNDYLKREMFRREGISHGGVK